MIVYAHKMSPTPPPPPIHSSTPLFDMFRQPSSINQSFVRSYCMVKFVCTVQASLSGTLLHGGASKNVVNQCLEFGGSFAHSKHRFPAPSSKVEQGCHHTVFGFLPVHLDHS